MCILITDLHATTSCSILIKLLHFGMWVGGQSLISSRVQFLFSNEVVHSLSNSLPLKKADTKFLVPHKLVFMYLPCADNYWWHARYHWRCKRVVLAAVLKGPHNMMRERERELLHQHWAGESFTPWYIHGQIHTLENKIYHPFHYLTLFFFFFFFTYPLFVLPGSYLYSWGLPLPKGRVIVLKQVIGSKGV
jgi:hypothetical protein